MLAKMLGKSNPFAPRTYGELHRVTDRVYIFRNITNSSFVIGDRGVAVIDTQVNHPLAEILLRHIRSVTDKPILYAINTHYHWDHTNGNQLFKDLGATVVSSRLTRKFMTTRHERQKDFLLGRGFEIAHDPMFPEQVFDGEMTLDVGSQPLRLFFAGKAETDDATVVWVEREKVVMAGDTVMTGSFPIFGQPVWDEGLEGTGQWQTTVRKLLALKPVKIVPGHGPLAGQKETDLLIKICDYFVDELRPLVGRGMSITAILNDLEPRLPKWITEIPVVWGSPRYAILRVWRSMQSAENTPSTMPGWQQFKPSALPHAHDFLEAAKEAREGGDAGLELRTLEQAAQISPNDPNMHAAYADALIEHSRAEPSVLEKGDFFSRAKSAWDRALELDPAHAPSLIGKGRYLVMMAYRGGDDPAAGLRLLETARKFAPNPESLAQIEFYTGVAHRRRGHEPRAKEHFKLAQKHNPAFMPATLALSS